MIYAVDRFAVRRAELLELGRGHARKLLELVGKVLGAAVAQVEGNLAKRLLVIHEQLLGFLDLLQDKKLFDCNAFHFGKQFADGGVILVNMFTQIFTYAEMPFYIT